MKLKGMLHFNYNKTLICFNSRVQKLIKHVAIRRLKTDQIDGKPLVDLPARRVEVNRIKFNEDERKLYDAMHKDGKLIVCKYVV